AAGVSGFRRAKAQIPGEPERAREGKEHDGEEDGENETDDFDLRPWLVRRSGDHPDDQDAKGDAFAEREIEDIRADPEVRGLASLEREAGGGTSILHLQPVAQNPAAAAPRTAEDRRTAEHARDGRHQTPPARPSAS